MSKNYCPVRIKNPATKNSLVRLLTDQKMHILFSGKEYSEYKIDVVGDYLAVEDVSEIEEGWMASIYQKSNLISYFESSLLLGGINLFDKNNTNAASFCVVSNSQNNDYLRVINPKNSFCNLSPDQVLDVVIYGSLNDNWTAYPSHKDLSLELIQHSTKPTKHLMSDGKSLMIEYFFRFRFNHKSVETLSHMPFAKMDAGSVLFVNSKKQRGEINVTCCWRGKSSIYKALLLPKMPNVTNHNFSYFGKKANRSCVCASINLRKIDSNDLSSGCTVIQSKA